MRLQHHPDAQPDIYLEFLGKIVNTDETHVAEAIKVATDEIAGNGKGISHTPLTLVVKKAGVPDLTMVDLPGITRVPVHGQPEDIYEQISRIIMEYIKPEESIILNVLSATVDFPTCESIRMSQRVDKTGVRTLAVVTKVDKAPEGLLEKVAADDVNIGLGYVCVRNRIGDESYQDARVEEATLFQSHPLLSKINKSMVGVPRLAQKLVQIQATMLSKCLPDIVRKINEKLNLDVSELSRMPPKLSSVAEAITAFMRIIGLSIESLRKILSRGEFDEYPDDKSMHCTVRLAEMLNEYSEELQKSGGNKSTENFLMDEIRVLDETKGIWLPNFLPRAAFLIILQRKVKEIANTPVDFVAKVWNYIESVVILVLMYHCDSYPQLLSSTRRAAQNLIAKMKEKSFDRVMELVEMEKLTDYTCSPEYMTEWAKLMAHQNAFRNVMNNQHTSQITIEGFGMIEVGHLRLYSSTREQAFDLKMRITAYWKIVLRRFVDNLALHLLLSINELVSQNMQTEIVKEVMGSHGGHGIERMLEESPSVAMKREKLNKSIRLLKQSKEVVAQIMDRISVNVD
ncbi:Dynamin-related protein 4C [Camellia lanceoleosa]|uniref:Dynamin-related protein 4C n=1 Tax=Camellia lanceoleosa TaxID=1840588 RepID=A0ACC0IHB5_9ERIC|nr:Dynamin-related protein 4C [Camellia lanceoleosa]